MFGAASAAGPAMEEHGRLADWIATKLPVDLVTVTDIQHAGLEWLDGRITLCLRIGAVGPPASRGCRHLIIVSSYAGADDSQWRLPPTQCAARDGRDIATGVGAPRACAVSDVFGWKLGLSRGFHQARGFHAIIIATTSMGMLMRVFGLDRIKALVWSAIVNSVISVPIMVVLVWIDQSRRVM
jgi:hypothetical protein